MPAQGILALFWRGVQSSKAKSSLMTLTPLRALLLSTALLFLGVPTGAQPGTILEQDQLHSEKFPTAVVTAGEPLAAKVGTEIMKRGGNAVDSATAVGLALAVTLPRAGNLGGGGFAIILSPDGEVHALDFRETAPQALHRDFYADDKHSSRKGPHAVSVPGTVAGLYKMHKRFGVLPWKEVVKPAERLALEGFPVSGWLQDGLTRSQSLLQSSPAGAQVFLPDGRPPRVGRLLIQRDLAKTLNRVSKSGAKDFYEGKTAELLVRGVQDAGGVLTLSDLASYEAKWRKPVSSDFNGYKVWSMPPPSSGGIHLLQMLEWMEPYALKAEQQNSAADLHKLAEVMRLAYCDRAKYLGDPDFVEVPIEKLLSPPYLSQRSKLIPPELAGNSERLAPELFQTPPPESADTTHFNVVDDSGMAVSLTYTLNFSYGSGFMAPGTGFLLNNEMDDFNAKPGQPNAYGLLGSSANNVEAGKRPLSSMTPTIITRDNKFYAALGAPGGSRIITGVFQSTLNLLAYGYNAQTSVTIPRVHHQWYPDLLFHELGISSDTLKLLTERGHTTKPIYAVAHVLAIVRGQDGHLETGLDPRRPAAAEGY